MKNIPLSVIIICIVFILAGITGIIYHANEWQSIGIDTEVVVAFLIRLAAVIGGVFALRGKNWARWLLVLWILYHVALSVFHPASELITHFVIAIIVGLCLFNGKANRYFRKMNA
jgi:hypothetical protein